MRLILLLSISIFLATACRSDRPSRGRNDKLPSGQTTTSTTAEDYSDPMGRPRPIEDKKPTVTPSDLGFFRINSSNIPVSVQNAARSVFEVRFLVGLQRDDVSVEDVSGQKAVEFQNKVKAQAVSEGFDELNRQIVLAQIERCKRLEEKDQKTCHITWTTKKVTGVLVGQGNILWVNAHAIEDTLLSKEAAEGVRLSQLLREGQTISAYVFDQDGKLLFDPNVEKVDFDVIPDLTRTARRTGKFYAEDSDYVALRLPKSFGQPLSPSNKKLTTYERVYLLGYASCTGCFASGQRGRGALETLSRGANRNSDGQGLWLSYGQILHVKNLNRFFEVSADAFENLELDTMLFYDADSTASMGGGAVVNTQGELLAIHSGGKSRSFNNEHRRVSRGVRPLELFPL